MRSHERLIDSSTRSIDTLEPVGVIYKPPRIQFVDETQRVVRGPALPGETIDRDGDAPEDTGALCEQDFPSLVPGARVVAKNREKGYRDYGLIKEVPINDGESAGYQVSGV